MCDNVSSTWLVKTLNLSIKESEKGLEGIGPGLLMSWDAAQFFNSVIFKAFKNKRKEEEIKSGLEKPIFPPDIQP